MSVVAMPDTVSSLFPTPTDLVYAVVTGGIAPYSYAWVLVAGGPNPAPMNPTSDGTRFAGVGSSIYRCDVTDAIGNVVSSNEVSADVD